MAIARSMFIMRITADKEKSYEENEKEILKALRYFAKDQKEYSVTIEFPGVVEASVQEQIDVVMSLDELGENVALAKKLDPVPVALDGDGKPLYGEKE